MTRHPSAEQIRRFLDEGGPRCSQETALHLLECPQCRREVIGESRAGVRGGRVARVLQHRARWASADESALREPSLQVRLGQATLEVAAAPALLAELRRRPTDGWTLLFANSDRFHSAALAREIVHAGHREARENPGAGAEMVRAALVLIDYLDPDVYGGLLDDLRARAWATVGDCLRLSGDLRAAAAAFRRAKRLVRDTVDPEELANYHYLRGVLAKDQRQTDRALEHFERARKLSEEIGDQEKLVRILTSSGVLNVERGQPEDALPLLLEASAMVESVDDERLSLFVRSNLALCLADLGDYAGAREIYETCRERYASAADSYLRLRARWLEGRIAAGLGENDVAESVLAAVRAAYLQREQHYNAALVSLHLATLYARQARHAELAVLAEEMTAVFVAQDVPAEAIAALAFFRQAVEQERATEELVGGVARFLQRARSEPGVRFTRHGSAR